MVRTPWSKRPGTPETIGLCVFHGTLASGPQVVSFVMHSRLRWSVKMSKFGAGVEMEGLTMWEYWAGVDTMCEMAIRVVSVLELRFSAYQGGLGCLISVQKAG